MIYTTLSRIRKHVPCADGWRRLIRHLGAGFPMDKPFPLVEILNAEGDGVADCLWALRAEPQHSKLYRLYAVRRARSVQHLMEDARSIAAIDVAERHANKQATDEELAVARGAAEDAAEAAAEAAAWAAAWVAAEAAAEDAAEDAAWGAAEAVARGAVEAVARGAARDAARADLREMLTNHHAMPGEPVV